MAASAHPPSPADFQHCARILGEGVRENRGLVPGLFVWRGMSLKDGDPAERRSARGATLRRRILEQAPQAAHHGCHALPRLRKPARLPGLCRSRIGWAMLGMAHRPAPDEQRRSLEGAAGPPRGPLAPARHSS